MTQDLFSPTETKALPPPAQAPMNGTSSSALSVQTYMTMKGLRLPPDLTFDAWATLAPQFREGHSRIQWAIGDWILYGENHKSWGDRYDQAINDLDYDYDYLRQLTRVCRAYDFAHRRSDISFSHHREALVFAPEERQNALKKVAAGKWSVQKFKEWISDEKAFNRRSGGARLPTGPKDDKKKDEDENAITVVIEKNEQAAVVQAASVVGKTSISSFLKGIADGTLKVLPAVPAEPSPLYEAAMGAYLSGEPIADDEQAEAPAPSELYETGVDHASGSDYTGYTPTPAWAMCLSPAARECLPDLQAYFRTDDLVDVVSQAVLGYYQIRKARMKTYKERNPE